MATFQELATKLRANIDKLNEERAAQSAIILRVQSAILEGEGREPSESESNEVRAAKSAIEGLDPRISDLRGQAETFEREATIAETQEREAKARKEQERELPARVGSEPEVYNRGNAQTTSFFRDMFAKFNGTQNAGVLERMQRYQEQSSDRMSERAVSTSSFSGLIPPQYLVDEAAALMRAGRPFANSVRKLPLPDQGMSLIIPRGTTGASAAVQPTENSNVSSTDEVWSNLTVPVITVAGQQDVSRQTLDRGTPGVDSIIFADLAGAYGVALDQQALVGTGASGQALGVLNTSGVTQATAFTAAVTPTTLLSKLAGAINSVQTTRFLPPDVIFMHPRRWSWLIAQVDASQRPLVVPDASNPHNAIGTFEGPQVAVTSATPVGQVLGIPVVTDASIPTTVGAASEDQIIVARWEDLMLWEDNDGNPTDLRFEQTLGNQLTVKLVAYGYAAFTAGRYPGAVAIVGGNSTAGNGLVAPTF